MINKRKVDFTIDLKLMEWKDCDDFKFQGINEAFQIKLGDMNAIFPIVGHRLLIIKQSLNSCCIVY